jgi:hypothetical protein
LDLAFDHVRDHLARELGTIVQETGISSLELEWLCGAGEAYPYDRRTQKELETGIATFLNQVCQALGPGQSLTVAVDDNPARARTWGYDWPAWATSGLVKRIVLRHRGQNVAQTANRVRRARALLGPGVELVSQLDCWRSDGLRDGPILAQAMDAVREAGADWVAIYRADAVEALGLWEQI